MQEKKIVSPLAALKGAKPSTLIGQLRAVWPDVQAAFDAGHTARDVHRALNESGIPISYNRLTDYRSRFNKTGRSTFRAAPLKPGSSSASAVETEGGQAGDFDPVANYRKHASKQINWEYPSRPIDEKKLVGGENE